MANQTPVAKSSLNQYPRPKSGQAADTNDRIARAKRINSHKTGRSPLCFCRKILKAVAPPKIITASAARSAAVTVKNSKGAADAAQAQIGTARGTIMAITNARTAPLNIVFLTLYCFIIVSRLYHYKLPAKQRPKLIPRAQHKKQNHPRAQRG